MKAVVVGSGGWGTALALLLLVCGFILDTVVKKHRQLFEINLNMLRLMRQKEEAE